MPSTIPLFARFPALAALPRAELGIFPSPVESLRLAGMATPLLVKRDDLNAVAFGGNKVRSLEFLLGGLAKGDVVLTVGGEGSTHVLLTAAHTARLGGVTVAVRWPHEMNATCTAVRDHAARLCARTISSRSPVTAMVRALAYRALHRVRYVKLGGSSPLGVLGHVNAALELAEQIARGEVAPPTFVVVPLGSGGTAAGLALGFALAGLDATVVGARVGPRLMVNRARTLRLAGRTLALIARLSGRSIAAPPLRLEVHHAAYGGAYGRPLASAGPSEATFVEAGGPSLDGTYSAKALTAALSVARERGGRVLFWLTFDARAIS